MVDSVFYIYSHLFIAGQTIEELKALVEDEMRHPYTVTGMGDYDEALRRASPDTDFRIHDFIQNSGLYDTSAKRWNALEKQLKTLNTLSTALSSIIQGIIDHFNIPNRRAVARRTRRKKEYLSMEPEVVVLGCSGSAFRQRELPQYPNYHSCVIPIAVKRNFERDHVQERTQLGLFARQCFDAQPHRKFVYAIGASQYSVLIHQFDRTGNIFCEPIALNDEPRNFVACILNLISADDGQVGFDATIRWKGRRRFIQTVDGSSQPIEYEVDTAIEPLRSPGVLGKGTTCWTVTHEGEKLVIKDTWRLFDGRKEEEFLLTARGLQGVAQMIAFEVGPTAAESRLVDKMDEHEDRQLIRLTLPEYGPTIDHFTSCYNLLFAFRDAVAGHFNLLKAGVLHRNISVDNILLGQEGCEEGNRGILVDLGQAIWTKDRAKGTSYRDLERMGTKPFQSITILQTQPGPHNYLDDLQSFFFVLCWICIAFEAPQKRKKDRPAVLETWCLGTPSERGAEKQRQLEGFDEHISPHISPYFGEDFINLLKRLLTICSQDDVCLNATSGALPDPETVYTKYLAAIDETIAALDVPPSQPKKRSLVERTEETAAKRLKKEVGSDTVGRIRKGRMRTRQK
ncbi:hypothetical protein AX16_006382 [Volvariella volvacea WC 439]|nr:hypothetical protein AX16_006382 [Volvariella volvacea WC 439]